MRINPERVLITHHAVERYLLRYPSDILPIRPEREIRGLLRTASPMPPRKAARFRHALKPDTLLLHSGKWVLPLAPHPGRARQGQWDWTLPTVMRNEPHANTATPYQQQRLRDWQAFRSGEAAGLLVALALELRTADVHALRREWTARGYPHFWHGGYPSFDEFYRSEVRAVHAALSEQQREVTPA